MQLIFSSLNIIRFRLFKAKIFNANKNVTDLKCWKYLEKILVFIHAYRIYLQNKTFRWTAITEYKMEKKSSPHDSFSCWLPIQHDLHNTYTFTCTVICTVRSEKKNKNKKTLSQKTHTYIYIYMYLSNNQDKIPHPCSKIIPSRAQQTYDNMSACCFASTHQV